MKRLAENITDNSETLIDLLTAQCADLEMLLILARCEHDAVERNDFEDLIRVVGERAALGDRLEVYHRQISELRELMGTAADRMISADIAVRTTAIAVEIEKQDRITSPMLATARNEIGNELARLDQAKRNIGSYLREGRMPAVACDQRA